MEKKLNILDLFRLGIGQIFGSGILTMLGIAITMTRKSVFLSILISGLLVLFSILPSVFLSSLKQLDGGDYSRIKLIAGEYWSSFYIFTFLLMNFSISMYAISFSQYFNVVNTSVPPRFVSIIIVTILFLVQLLGDKHSKSMQKLTFIFILMSYPLFIFFGFKNIKIVEFFSGDLFPKGILGVLKAGAYMSFSVSGSQLLINYSSRAKNPTRDIPLVMIVSTIFVTIIYSLMSVVATGILPINKVSGKPLTLVAERIMPPVAYLIFIIGGALFGLMGTMNSQIGGSVFPLIQACKDNILPSKLLKFKLKNGVYFGILSIMYAIVMLPIILGWDIALISNTVIVLVNFVNFISGIATIQFLKRHKKMINNHYRLKLIGLILSLIAMLIMIVLVLGNLNKIGITLNIILLVTGLLFSSVMKKNKLFKSLFYKNNFL